MEEEVPGFDTDRELAWTFVLGLNGDFHILEWNSKYKEWCVLEITNMNVLYPYTQPHSRGEEGGTGTLHSSIDGWVDIFIDGFPKREEEE